MGIYSKKLEHDRSCPENEDNDQLVSCYYGNISFWNMRTNTTESDARSYEATKAVAKKKEQKKSFMEREIFLGSFFLQLL